MPLGMTQSKAEMRSLATKRKASPRSKISRTLPLFSFGIPGRSSVKTVPSVMALKYGKSARMCKRAVAEKSCRKAVKLGGNIYAGVREFLTRRGKILHRDIADFASNLDSQDTV